MSFETRENMYMQCVQDHDGTMGRLDVIEQKEYKNESVHHYIRIRRSNGTIGLYETDGLYTWVIENNGTDPLTREDLWYQRHRLESKKLWKKLYSGLKTSDITAEFKQQCLTDYLQNPDDVDIKEKARAFVDIATFELGGLVHKGMTFNETSEFLKNTNGWMLRISSIHKTVQVKKNTQIIVFCCGGYQQRFQETDGMGYMLLSGSVVGNPMTSCHKVEVSLIDLIEYSCSRQGVSVKDIIKPK